MPKLNKPIKILFATYPEYYKQDFLNELKSESRFSITELTCCDILNNLCNSKPYKDPTSVSINIMFKQYYKEIYLCSEQFFEGILNDNNALFYKRQYILDNTFKLMSNIYDAFQLSIIEHKNITLSDKNPIRDFLNESTNKNLKKLEYIVDSYVKTHDIILIPGTNRSIASPLVCSLDLLNMIMKNNKPLNKSTLEGYVENICGLESFDMMHNFFDTLIIMLIHKRAIKQQKLIISLCHGAQVGYAYFGGYIDYSFRKTNPGKWNVSKVQFGTDHMLHKTFNLKGFNNGGEYFNTVFMVAPDNQHEINTRLMTLTRTYENIGIIDLYSLNKSFVEYYRYNDTVHGLQIHIENSIASRSCLINFIINSTNSTNSNIFLMNKENGPTIGPKIQSGYSLKKKDFFNGNYNDDEFQEFNFSVNTISEIV